MATKATLTLNACASASPSAHASANLYLLDVKTAILSATRVRRGASDGARATRGLRRRCARLRSALQAAPAVSAHRCPAGTVPASGARAQATKHFALARPAAMSASDAPAGPAEGERIPRAVCLCGGSPPGGGRAEADAAQDGHRQRQPQGTPAARHPRCPPEHEQREPVNEHEPNDTSQPLQLQRADAPADARAGPGHLKPQAGAPGRCDSEQ